MSRINLLPDSYVTHERRRRAMNAVLAVAIVFAVICGAWGWIAYSQLRSLDARLDAAQARLSTAKERSRALDNDRASVAGLRALLTHRAQLESPVPAPGVLALLTHLLPESVAVTRLSMDLPDADLTDRSNVNGAKEAALPPAADVPTRVELEGLALSDVELAKVVGTLASHKAFANVKLVRSRHVTMAGVTRFSFQITLDVPAALPAPAKPVARTAEKGSRGA